MGKLSYIIDKEQSKQNSDSGADMITSMVMGARQTVEQLTQSLEVLSSKIDEVESRLNGAVGSISIPDHNSSLLNLAEQIRGVQQAVASIEIPKVPPFPKIPQPKDVDLSPVLQALERLEAKEIEFPEMELSMPESPKKEWTFEIERDNYGGISRVVAKEV